MIIHGSPWGVDREYNRDRRLLGIGWRPTPSLLLTPANPGGSFVARQATRRNTTQILLPPNPNEFERTVRTVRLRRVVGDVAEVALGVGVVEVDGGRDRLVVERGQAGEGFDGGRGAEQVAGHALGRADGDCRGGVAEDLAEGAGLEGVADGRARWRGR